MSTQEITPQRYDVMYVLAKTDYETPTTIAKILRTQNTTINTCLTNLTNDEFVIKNGNKNPKKITYVLSPQGKEFINNHDSEDDPEYGPERARVLNLIKYPKRLGFYATIVAGLVALGLIKTTSASASSAAVASSAPISTSSTVITTGTTTTSILTTKTVMASILATIMVTGGMVGPYALDPNIFGNSIPDVPTMINENSDSSTSQKLSSSHSSSDTGTSSKSAKSSASANAPSFTATTQSAQTPSQESNLENTQNNVDSQTTDSSSGSFSSSGPITSLIPSVTPLSQFPKNAISVSTTDIKVDKSNNRWVTDSDNNQVRKLNSEGETILVIGGTTQEDTITPTSHFDIIPQNIQLLVMPYAYADDSIILNKPTRIAIDNSPAGDTVYVYIVDSGNKRILKVDQDGNHMSEFRFDYSNSGITDPNIASSNDGNSLLVNDGLTFYLLDSDKGNITKSDDFNVNLKQIIVRDQYIYGLDDVAGTISIFDSDSIVDILPLKDENDKSLISFSFTVDKSEQFIYVFGIDPSGGSNPDRILYNYDIDGTLLDSQKYDGFITVMDIDSDGNILALDVVNEQITTISFEDAIASFSAKFDEIMCNADLMINDPISVSSEVTAALPISELLPRADSLTFNTQQYEEGLLFYYITSQIQPTNVDAWNGIGYTQTQICSNDSAEIAYAQALSIDPNNINAKIGLADLTINQVIREGNASILKLEDAELQLQSVLDLDSRNTNALNALGYIETIRDDYNAAIDYYEQSLKINNKKTTTLNGLAFAHLRSDNFGEATTIYLKVINIDPNNFNALIGLITTYTQQGFPELVEQFADKLSGSNGIVADKLIEQGNWLQKNGQTQEAQRLFDAAKELRHIN